MKVSGNVNSDVDEQNEIDKLSDWETIWWIKLNWGTSIWWEKNRNTEYY